MRRIKIENIKPGTKIAKSIYSSYKARPLLVKGVELKESYVTRLREMGVYHVMVEDDISEGIEVAEIVSEEVMMKAREVTRNIMQKIINKEDDFDARPVNRVVDMLVDDILKNTDIMVNISDIMSVDDYTFGHSLNVCILSLVVGVTLQYNGIRLRDLGIGSLLHDIGKLKMPIKILNKPDVLSKEEFEIIKRHTVEGFEILRKCDNLSRSAIYVSLGHHERCDGTGYPQNLAADEIHEFTKIVGVVDVYDAMTSDRVYKKGVEPSRAIEFLVSMGNKLFDYRIIKKFVSNISMYPEGTGVLLNTNERAIVVKVEKGFSDRPIIRLVGDSVGNRYDTFTEINLSQKQDIYIVGTCEIA